MKKNLYFFTAEFPFGKGETFIENELPILASLFDKIIIFPLSDKKGNPRAVPSNVDVKAIMRHRNGSSGKIFFSNFFFILKVLLNEFFYSSSRFYFLFHLRRYNSILIRAIADAEIMENNCDLKKDAVLYSFWMDDWALAMAVLKKKGKIKEFVFRCGGYDIYDERHPGNYLPFRYFIYGQTSAIYPNSAMGERYLKAKKMFPEKVEKQYWGTTDHGLNILNKSEIFTLVSCSNLIGLKRVELIVEILKHIPFNLRWIHFGDGVLMEKIKEMCRSLPENIQYDFKGSLPNSEIIRFYKEQTVHLFITTSETEGLPVSIQEAISFGIPVMATAVGGIPEVVNEFTGVLLEKNFDVKRTAEMLTDLRTKLETDELYRANVRKFWTENFEAGRNYTYFYEKLIKKQ